jgi:uncharacterized protein YkwD
MKKVFVGLALTIALILTGVTITVFSQKTPQTAPTQATEPITEPKPVVTVSMLDADILFNMVNEERAKVGVKPLIRDAKLDASAQTKADDMAIDGYFNHIDPVTGVHGYTLIPKSCTYRSENITKSATTDRNRASVDGWMNSPPHKKALLDPDYELTGFGVNGDIGVQHFCDLD